MEKYGRSFSSMDKELKFVGYRVRKYRYSDDDNQLNDPPKDNQNVLRVYRWRGKR